jgi:hypothetical protein
VKLDRGRCPECGRVVAALVPRGGDGSALVARAHRLSPWKHSRAPFCKGSRREVRELVLPGEEVSVVLKDGARSR